MIFEWNEEKSKTNIKKHGISFKEAITVFYDDNGRVIHDLDHSEYEDRFIILGRSKSLRLLVVCHCHRDYENSIRIISARRATKNEEKQYMGFLT